MSSSNIKKGILFGVILTVLLSTNCWAISFNPGTGHWYDIVSSGISGAWDNAENNAVALGGHLVAINDAAEETWLRSTFGTSTRYWIGFNDAALEGTWVWSGSDPVTYTHWNTGEPNNAMPPPIGEDYAVLNWNTSTGAWNDWDHQRADYFNISGVAEFTSNPVPEPATMLLLGSCLIGLAGFRRKFKK